MLVLKTQREIGGEKAARKQVRKQIRNGRPGDCRRNTEERGRIVTETGGALCFSSLSIFTGLSKAGSRVLRNFLCIHLME
jgi:hypothetical protein